MDKSSAPTYIDLFAGCGGLSLGLYKSGWAGLFAIEKNEMAFETLKHNLVDKNDHFSWPDWLPKQALDINYVLRKYRSQLEGMAGKVDMVAGGPPCQGFSFAGKRREHDERNSLVDSYLKFIQIIKPRVVFFENVRGFTVPFKKNSLGVGKAYSEIVSKKLTKLNYNVHGEIMNFANYGVPQNRERYILIGVMGDEPEKFFSQVKNKKANFLETLGLYRRTPVGSALSDLERIHGERPSTEFAGFSEGVYSKPRSGYQRLLRSSVDSDYPDSHRFANHNPETIRRFSMFITASETGNRRFKSLKKRLNIKKSCIRVLNRLKPAPTLTCLPDDYVHYSESRILTVREYARLQSFDDWFEFRGKYTTGGFRRLVEVPRYTQIGNAIPPLFGQQAGNALEVAYNG